jgi:hypothetical protein
MFCVEPSRPCSFSSGQLLFIVDPTLQYIIAGGDRSNWSKPLEVFEVVRVEDVLICSHGVCGRSDTVLPWISEYELEVCSE